MKDDHYFDIISVVAVGLSIGFLFFGDVSLATFLLVLSLMSLYVQDREG